ncbi:Notch-regulated ankyrin repeat-containing protein [Lamellibrachia satsuma]|nr:Notch-regulated ankyrin repeat-containing protein [Lamellibrachia satsuma]
MSQPGVADVSTTMPPVCPSQRVFEAAVRSGDSLELQRLLEGRHGKFNVNFYDDDGQTALHQSCLGGNIELVKLLVRFGADVRLANRDGFNALHIAAYSGHQDIAVYLINAFKR